MVDSKINYRLKRESAASTSSKVSDRLMTRVNIRMNNIRTSVYRTSMVYRYTVYFLSLCMQLYLLSPDSHASIDREVVVLIGAISSLPSIILLLYLIHKILHDLNKDVYYSDIVHDNNSMMTYTINNNMRRNDGDDDSSSTYVSHIYILQYFLLSPVCVSVSILYSQYYYITIVPSVCSIVLHTIYNTYIVTYIPIDTDILSSSNIFNTFVMPLSSISNILINYYIVHYSDHTSVPYSLYACRMIIPLMSMYVNVYHTVLYNDVSYIVHSVHMISIYISLHSIIRTYITHNDIHHNVYQCVLCVLVLLSTITVKVLYNVCRDHHVVHIDTARLSLRSVVCIVHHYRQHMDGSDGRKYMDIVYRGEMHHKDGGGMRDHQYILHLLSILYRGRESSVFVNVLYIYYTICYNMNMYDLSYVYSRMVGRRRGMGVVERYMVHIIQQHIYDHMIHVHTYNMHTHHGRYIDHVTDEASSSQTDDNMYLSSLCMYHTLIHLIDHTVRLAFNMFTLLSQVNPELPDVHRHVHIIEKESSKCESLFVLLDEIKKVTPGNMIHLLTYAIFIDNVFNQKERAMKLVKEFQISKSKRTFKSIKINTAWEQEKNLAPFERGVCFCLDGGVERMGYICWVSNNFESVFKMDSSVVINKPLEVMMTDQFNESHRYQVLNFSKKWDSNYLRLPKERVINLEDQNKIFIKVMIEIQFSLDLTKGIKYLSMVRRFIDDESFVILDMNGKMVGRSQDLGEESLNPNYSIFMDRGVGVISKKLEFHYFHHLYHQLLRTKISSAEILLARLRTQNMRHLDVYRDDWDTPPQDGIDILILNDLLPRSEPSHRVSATFRTTGMNNEKGEYIYETYIYLEFNSDRDKPNEQDLTIHDHSSNDGLQRDLNFLGANLMHGVNKQLELTPSKKFGRSAKAVQNMLKVKSPLKLLRPKAGAHELVINILTNNIKGINRNDDRDSVKDSLGSSIKRDRIRFVIGLSKRGAARLEVFLLILFQLVVFSILFYLGVFRRTYLDVEFDNLITVRKSFRYLMAIDFDLKQVPINLIEMVLRNQGLRGEMKDVYNFTGATRMSILEDEYDYNYRELGQDILAYHRFILDTNTEITQKLYFYQNEFSTEITPGHNEKIQNELSLTDIPKMMLTTLELWRKYIITSDGLNDYITLEYNLLLNEIWDLTWTNTVVKIIVKDTEIYSVIKSNSIILSIVCIAICIFFQLASLILIYIIQRKIVRIYSGLLFMRPFEIIYKLEYMAGLEKALSETLNPEIVWRKVDFMEKLTPVTYENHREKVNSTYSSYKSLHKKTRYFFGFGCTFVIAFTIMISNCVIKLVLVQVTSKKGNQYLDSMLQLRRYQRLLYDTNIIQYKIYFYVFGKSGLRNVGKPYKSYRDDQLLLINDYQTNLRSLRSYLDLLESTQVTQTFGFKRLRMKPAEFLDYQKVGLSLEDFEKIADKSMGRTIMEVHAWQLGVYQRLYNELEFILPGQIYSILTDVQFLELEFMRKYFLKQDLIDFKTLFFRELDVYVASDKNNSDNIDILIFFIFLCSFTTYILGIKKLRKETTTAIYSYCLIPSQSYYQNAMIKAHLQKISKM